jgi:hypothetical protein
MRAVFRMTKVVGRSRGITTCALLLATAASFVSLAGCMQVYENDVGLGRLTGSEVKPTRSRIVYGVDASRTSVALVRLDAMVIAPTNDGKCGVAIAEPPKESNGLTYFVFDASPGTYVVSDTYNQVNMKVGQSAFVVPAGQEVYLGDFLAEGAVGANLDAVKAAFGRRAAHLELAETVQAKEDSTRLLGGICKL